MSKFVILCALISTTILFQCCYAEDIKRAEDRCNNLQIQIQEKIQDLEEIKELCITKEELEELLEEYREDLNSNR